MPQLTFPILTDGLLVDALVGLAGPATTALVAANQPIPRPLVVRGIIDTGSDVSAVSEATLLQLGIGKLYRATTTTFSGSTEVDICLASLSITNFNDPQAALFVQPNVVVMKMLEVLPKSDVVLGRNALEECRTIIDGPRKVFTLEF
jgi:hypothetical protein